VVIGDIRAKKRLRSKTTILGDHNIISTDSIFHDLCKTISITLNRLILDAVDKKASTQSSKLKLKSCCKKTCNPEPVYQASCGYPFPSGDK
jgi:hypothetical protein